MKTVFFARHAKSSWDHAELSDFKRPLNNRGLRDAPFMGKLLHAKGAQPDLIISSPAVRALTTAEYFAKALGIAPSEIRQEKSVYEAFPEDIMDLIQALPNALSTVFLFGHNPSMTALANQFSPGFIANIPTCGVFQVNAEVEEWGAFTSETGLLAAYHYPKQYFS